MSTSDHRATSRRVGGFIALARVVRITAMFDWPGAKAVSTKVSPVTCAELVGKCRRGEETLAEQAAIQAYNKAASLYGFVGHGAFTRFRELSLSARVPQRLVRPMGASAASVTLSARNLHLWTDWLAGDPEVNYNTGNDQTLTYSSPPLPRTFIARLNLSSDPATNESPKMLALMVAGSVCVFAACRDLTEGDQPRHRPTESEPSAAGAAAWHVGGTQGSSARR